MVSSVSRALFVSALLLTRSVNAPTHPARPPHSAELVLLSARIWTGDPAHPEAQALAVRDGRIAAIGSNAEIEKLRGPRTTVIDGKNHRVFPDSSMRTFTCRREAGACSPSTCITQELRERLRASLPITPGRFRRVSG